MLFRDKNGNIVQILKYNYVNDTLYYRYILENIYNITDKKYELNNTNNTNKTNKNVMENIISLIKKS